MMALILIIYWRTWKIRKVYHKLSSSRWNSKLRYFSRFYFEIPFFILKIIWFFCFKSIKNIFLDKDQAADQIFLKTLILRIMVEFANNSLPENIMQVFLKTFFVSFEISPIYSFNSQLTKLFFHNSPKEHHSLSSFCHK